MPWTFSHPAAVLPLARLRFLSLPALVCGSLTPDVGYYFGLHELAARAHSIPGTIWIGIPTGLLCLLAFYMCRRPVWFLLPQPHRHALQPFVARRPKVTVDFIVVAVASVLLGAWTHLLWDSFTHWNKWGVRLFPELGQTWVVGGTVLPGYAVMQHLSTLVGAAMLCIAYFSWLSRQPRVSHADHHGNRVRYRAIAGAIVFSLAIAVPTAHAASTDPNGDFHQSMFIFRVAVFSASIFAALLVAFSAYYFAKLQKR
jgi:hypothetical protein